MTIPTIAAIRDQILADIQTGLGLTEPLLPRSVWGIFATAIAGVVVLVYRFGAWVERQIFTQTADVDALVLRAGEHGLARTPATEWRGTITITGTTATVPIGTLWQFNGLAYEQTTALDLVATGTASIRSLELGTELNRFVSDELSIVTPIAGVNRTATVLAVTQVAADVESLEAFRSRILARQQSPPQGGAIPDWILWATEVPGIAEAFIERPLPGFITIYPLLDVADPANRIPDAPKLAEVAAHVTDPRRSPIRASEITVLAPTELDFDVNILVMSPNNPALRDAIETAIEAYMYAARPKQYADEVDPLDVISAAQITRLVVDAGAQEATVDLKTAGGASITKYTLDAGEVAALRTVTWP